MDAYRDQYAQIFGDTGKVTLLTISVDPDTMLAAWAGEKKYAPWTFLSDPKGMVGRQYGATKKFPLTPLLDNRTLYVVDRHGIIVHVMAPFRETDPTAYTDLEAAIKKASAGP
jgi:peroxiredoxin